MHKSHLHRQDLEIRTPDIIIYPRRWRTMLWLSLGAISLIPFLLIIFLIILIPASRNIGAVFAACLAGGLGVVGIWPTWTVAGILLSNEPMLTITHQGISVGKIYSSSRIVLVWQEVEMISMLNNGLGVQLMIRPRNISLFLSRFSPPVRLFLRLNLVNGAPIAIAQSFLEMPIEEILHQLEVSYKAELKRYHIQH